MSGGGKRIRLCRISAKDAAWIEERWKWLESTLGRDCICSAVVVRPTAEFFPDKFNGTPECAEQMLKRVAVYMGVDEDTVELSLFHSAPTVGFNREIQAKGLYWNEHGKQQIAIDVAGLKEPLALAATLSHELGHVRLLGGQLITPEEEDHEPLTDLLTVALGMGIIVANSVLSEFVVEYENCSSWCLSRSGYLSISLWGYALACFAETRGESRPAWTRDLRPDIRGTFEDAVKLRAHRRLTLQKTGDPVDSSDDDGFLEQYDPISHLEFNKEPQPDIHDEAHSPYDSSTSLTAEELIAQYKSGRRDFRSLDLFGLELSRANLSGCRFDNSDLTGCNLSNADLSDANLFGADLRDANLTSATLMRANLTGTSFLSASLLNANLQLARLRNTNFCNATLENTDFSNCRFDRTTVFYQANYENAIADDSLKRVMTGELSSLGKVAVFSFAIFWKVCAAAIILFPISLWLLGILWDPYLRAVLLVVLIVAVAIAAIVVFLRRQLFSRAAKDVKSN